MTTPGRRLIVMRHARAEAFAAEDRARALTARGREDAAEAGRWLASNALLPGRAIISSADRTTQTWECVEHVLGSGSEVVHDDLLYTASPAAVIDLIEQVPADVQVLLVLGHNPTVSYLAHILDDGHPDEDAFREMSEGFPTAALAVLEVPGDWAGLAEAGAHIAAFHVGRA